MLFGSNKGCIINPRGLSAFECLDYIIATGEQNPSAVHVGFAFNYDSNMIVQSLSPSSLARLHKNGWVRVKSSKGYVYVITFTRGKFFRVTRYREGSNSKITVQIFDVFSFFACSFIQAYTKLVGPVPEVVVEGKSQRGKQSIDDLAEIDKYWRAEILLMQELASVLRDRIYAAGLPITKWYGPGALASLALTQHGIKQHMQVFPDEVRRASRYAYAAGRFELFRVGRITGPVYGIDINSAYPFALSQLPSFNGADFRHVVRPTGIDKFGIYRLRLRKYSGLSHAPGPVFHRDHHHSISFPWYLEGWYHGPEAYMAWKHGADILEGFVLRYDKSLHPFSWVSEMYNLRREWKSNGNAAQLALKLCMNSITGKAVQRKGWTPQRPQIPPWFQLEWGGWVTSYTRARLFNILSQIPFQDLIAIETDGIYTTYPPEKLGITHSDELGGWSVSEYKEVLYVQSGLAWLYDYDGNWTAKRRGIDPCREGHSADECDCEGTFSLTSCQQYLHTLQPGQPWHPYIGKNSRFIGLGQALASKQGLMLKHCLWETRPRELSPAQSGKRIHLSKLCFACQQGLTAYDGSHDLVINSTSIVEPMSVPHTVPWEDEEIGKALWRETKEIDDDSYQDFANLS